MCELGESIATTNRRRGNAGAHNALDIELQHLLFFGANAVGSVSFLKPSTWV